MTWDVIQNEQGDLLLIAHGETPPDGWAVVAETANPEYLTPQPIVVPQEVTAGQAQAALHMAGLLDDVEALMENPATDRLVKIAWNKALTFKRDSPTVAAMAALLGMDSAQVDNLFIMAAQIEF